MVRHGHIVLAVWVEVGDRSRRLSDCPTARLSGNPAVFSPVDLAPMERCCGGIVSVGRGAQKGCTQFRWVKVPGSNTCTQRLRMCGFGSGCGCGCGCGTVEGETVLYRFGSNPMSCLCMPQHAISRPRKDPSCRRLLRPAIWHLAVRIGMGVCALPRQGPPPFARGKRKRRRIQKHKHKHMHTPTGARVI